MENIELIEKAVAYVKNNATNIDISVSDVAVNAGFSIDYFNRLFLSHTGFTVMSYINYIRMKIACTLLRKSNKSILDIALEVGYDSHEGFTKAFKKKYGINPSEYRTKMKNKIFYWGELTDKAVTGKFIHDNPDFKLISADLVIDFLLEKDPKRYGYFCSLIKYMGFEIAVPDGDLEQGLIAICDNRQGGYFLELVTDDLQQLSEWIKRFDTVSAFYSLYAQEDIECALVKHGVHQKMKAIPQTMYFGGPLKYQLSDNIKIRPLNALDIEDIRKWANGKTNGYIAHLLNKKDYEDDSVLEYGVFCNDELIAVVGCGIDEICELRLNNCCVIRFADGKENENLYREIFAYTVNDIMDKGIIPFDDIQHGEYAITHGGFTSVELGFEIVNWRYTLQK